ncbi:hypothetical protein PRIPAC_74422 [Pristionchus pacificus]|uniref:Uncharacterized protein n=1 Tax=Pristionchus pacificus TaxID=54126 RepID=A0A2A6CSK4_PRIPA|nr:hypothetical protein PRIPAC_74422 [Pristionchus pacificus]|eukprot:PDM81192.1 hypothetical protein PRIPAC_36195 [Pristionchus pacificus]
MTDVLSPEQLADREALRALLKDEVQRNFELGYLTSKLRTSEKHLAKDKDGKTNSTILVDSAIRDVTLLCPHISLKLYEQARPQTHSYRPPHSHSTRQSQSTASKHPLSDITRYFNDKKDVEKARLDRATKGVESMKEKCYQQWTALFNKGEIETEHQAIEKTNELDVA